MKTAVLFIHLFLSVSTIYGQGFLTPGDTLNKKRLIGVSATSALAWGGSISALQFVWYKHFEKSKFHFFDDSHEWGQMDKMGHMYTSWQFAGLVNDMYKWSGLDHKKSAIIGAGFSFGYMTTFEFLDAYNAKWGFSWSDVGFNALGTFTYFSQAYLWNEQFVKFKFSYHPSGLAKYRPDVLGSDFTSQLLKDYNGQTYWMSFNPVYWFKKEHKIPKWLQLSLGYSIQDQLIGDGGTYVVSNGVEQINFRPYRQYYLSLDIDFESIPTKSRALKLLFRGLNVLKFPFPAASFSEKGIGFHPLYF